MFELLIPVSKATGQVKDKLKEMQEQQAQQQRQYQQKQANTAKAQPVPPKKSDTDYIEFEEVK